MADHALYLAGFDVILICNNSSFMNVFSSRLTSSRDNCMRNRETHSNTFVGDAEAAARRHGVLPQVARPLAQGDALGV